MQIVKNRPVVVDQAEWIPRKHVTAMIANRLDGGEGAEEHALACGELSEFSG